MYRHLRLAVVIPAFNESRKIAATVASVPGIADHIVVVDDASSDDTSAQAHAAGLRRAAPDRVLVAGGDRGADPAVLIVTDDDGAVGRGAAKRGGGRLRGRIIGRRVVDDEDVVDDARHAGDGGRDLPGLVVGGDDHRDAQVSVHRAGLYSVSQRRATAWLITGTCCSGTRKASSWLVESTRSSW